MYARGRTTTILWGMRSSKIIDTPGLSLSFRIHYPLPSHPFRNLNMSPIVAIKLASLPACFMLLSTIAGLRIWVPETLAGALQHFAAGILLCTIGTELLPAMSDASGFYMNLACFFGFFAGVGVILTLGTIFLEDHDDEERETKIGRRESALKRSILPMQQALRPSNFTSQ